MVQGRKWNLTLSYRISKNEHKRPECLNIRSGIIKLLEENRREKQAATMSLGNDFMSMIPQNTNQKGKAGKMQMKKHLHREKHRKKDNPQDSGEISPNHRQVC